MDGLSSFPEAVRAVYPQTWVQLCIAHVVCNSARFVSHKDLKKVCTDLKAIYSAATKEAGRAVLSEFGEFFKYPPEIRRAIYATNAVESLTQDTVSGDSERFEKMDDAD